MDAPLDGIGARTAQLAGLARLDQGDLERSRAAKDPEQAAKMFEELLATALVREMRRGLEDGFFGGAPGSDVYEGWLDEHVGRALARSGTLEVAQAVRISLGRKDAAKQDGTEATR